MVSMNTMLLMLCMIVMMVAVESALSPPMGVLSNQAMWTRARTRVQNKQEPFYSLYTQTMGRANLNAVPYPFRMVNMSRPIADGGIYYGWKTGGNITLTEAVNRLQTAGWTLQAYALTYVFTNDTRYAVKLLDYMSAWANQHTPVNMYDFHIDFVNTKFDGIQGSDFQTDRPWNFALDCMWQTYGLMGISDAYLLLKNSGYKISSTQDTLFRNWIKSVASAVNSGFHSWTRWADAHPTSGAIVRYRSDNHLSWAQTGLIAAGVALGDTGLVNHVLSGTAWKDIKAPLYSNPSHFREMISKAIQPVTGLMYEQLISRTPLIGYSFFHIQALMEIAQIGEIHTGQDLFGYVGRNATSMKLAYDTYAKYPLGLAVSPDPAEAKSNFTTTNSWLYQLAYSHWKTSTNFKKIASLDPRGSYILQGLGPYQLFWDEDL